MNIRRLFYLPFLFYEALCNAFVTLITYKCTHTYNMIPKHNNNSDWTLPSSLQSLYSPPKIVPYIPYSIARTLLIQRFVYALNINNDVLIMQCDSFRRAINEHKLLIGVIGDDFLVGYIPIKNIPIGKNIVYIHTILPLNGTGHYNITGMIRLFNVQYNPCIFNYTFLSTYWKTIINLYFTY